MAHVVPRSRQNQQSITAVSESKSPLVQAQTNLASMPDLMKHISPHYDIRGFEKASNQSMSNTLLSAAQLPSMWVRSKSNERMTQHKLMQSRKEAFKAHLSFDLDGDGTVS
jgi:hypothetical protein